MTFWFQIIFFWSKNLFGNPRITVVNNLSSDSLSPNGCFVHQSFQIILEFRPMVAGYFIYFVYIPKIWKECLFNSQKNLQLGKKNAGFLCITSCDVRVGNIETHFILWKIILWNYIYNLRVIIYNLKNLKSFKIFKIYHNRKKKKY